MYPVGYKGEMWFLWCADHGKFWSEGEYDRCECGYQTNEPKLGDAIVVSCEICGADLASKTQCSCRKHHQSCSFPSKAEDRKAIPIVTGVLDYFPDALIEVAKVSKAGNDQHNPGEPLHWDRTKSMDQADSAGRHLMQRGTRDVDGQRHSAKAAWRTLALLQLEIEGER